MEISLKHPNQYYNSAQEKLKSAKVLYDNECYTCSIYYAGLAVESMYRAYNLVYSRNIDKAHKLYELEKRSMIFEKIHHKDVLDEYTMAKAYVIRCWNNLFRFFPSNDMTNHIKSAKLVTIKKNDNVLKKFALEMYNNCEIVIKTGNMFFNPLLAGRI